MNAIWPGHELYEEMMQSAKREYDMWNNRNSKETLEADEYGEQIVYEAEADDDYTFLFDTSTEDTE